MIPATPGADDPRFGPLNAMVSAMRASGLGREQALHAIQRAGALVGLNGPAFVNWITMQRQMWRDEAEDDALGRVTESGSWKRSFLRHLRETGDVREAAELAGVHRSRVYQVRNDPNEEVFRAAWIVAKTTYRKTHPEDRRRENLQLVTAGRNR